MGNVICRSTSSGPSAGATVLICTCTGVVSGKASTSNRRRASTPAIAAASTTAITSKRFRREKSMIRFRMFIEGSPYFPQPQPSPRLLRKSWANSAGLPDGGDDFAGQDAGQELDVFFIAGPRADLAHVEHLRMVGFLIVLVADEDELRAGRRLDGFAFHDDRVRLAPQKDSRRAERLVAQSQIRITERDANSQRARTLVDRRAEPRNGARHVLRAMVGVKLDGQTRADIPGVLLPDAEQKPQRARIGDGEQQLGRIDNFARHDIGGHNHAGVGGSQRKQVGRLGFRGKSRQNRRRNSQKTNLFRELFRVAALEVVGHFKAEIHQGLPGRDECDLRFLEGGLGLRQRRGRNGNAVAAKPFESCPPELAFDDRVEKLRFRLPDLGGIDQGDDLPGLDAVVHLLEDRGHRALQARRQMGDPCRIESDFPVGDDGVRHRPLADDVDIDSGLLCGRLGSQLHATQVQRVLRIVLRPRHQGDCLCRVVARQLRRAVDLSQLRMIDHAFRHAVRGQNPNSCGLGSSFSLHSTQADSGTRCSGHQSSAGAAVVPLRLQSWGTFQPVRWPTKNTTANNENTTRLGSPSTMTRRQPCK